MTAVISAICVYVCVGMRNDGLSLALSGLFRAHVRPMDITGTPGPMPSPGMTVAGMGFGLRSQKRR